MGQKSLLLRSDTCQDLSVSIGSANGSRLIWSSRPTKLPFLYVMNGASRVLNHGRRDQLFSIYLLFVSHQGKYKANMLCDLRGHDLNNLI